MMLQVVRMPVVTGVLMLGMAGQLGQAAVVFQDNFDLGDRPRGSSGDIRTTRSGDSIDDYWVAFPGDGAARWQSVTATPDSGWRWGAQSDDPLEPAMPGQAAKNPSNGVAFGKGISSAAAPVAVSAGTSYTLTAGVLNPNNYFGNPDPGADLLRIGFAGASGDVENLDEHGVAWLVLRSTGLLELHAGGAVATTALSGHTMAFNTLEHLTLQYDAGAGEVRGWSEGSAVLALPLATFSPTVVGMDSHIVTNDDLIASVGYLRVTNVVPEPATAGVMALGLGVLVGRRRRRAE
jgi:hypothetical protein